jgi:hypothetical protein
MKAHCKESSRGKINALISREGTHLNGYTGGMSALVNHCGVNFAPLLTDHFQVRYMPEMSFGQQP